MILVFYSKAHKLHFLRVRRSQGICGCLPDIQMLRRILSDQNTYWAASDTLARPMVRPLDMTVWPFRRRRRKRTCFCIHIGRLASVWKMSL